MKYDRDDIRRLTAQDYARRALGNPDEIAWLFDLAIREGEIAGLAGAIEIASGRNDQGLVETLRAMCPEPRGPKS